MQLNSVSSYDDVLNRVAIAFRAQQGNRPPAREVVQALIQAEKAAKRDHRTIPFEAVAGQWRLCFTANRGARQTGDRIVGRGWYMPGAVPAQIGFFPDPDRATSDTGTITNQINLAGITLQFSGVCRARGRKNIVVFDFLNLQLKVFGRSLFQQEVRGGQAKAEDVLSGNVQSLPFFAFFMATEHFIAARGRGGGLAIWVKMPDIQL